MTRVLWDDTVPFHDTVPIRVKLDRADAHNRAEMRKRFIPRGCDQQGRVEPGWQQSGFSDGRGEWSLLGLELLALSAVIVISIIAWIV